MSANKFESEIERLTSAFADLGLIPHTTVMHWLGKHNHFDGSKLTCPQEILDYMQRCMSPEIEQVPMAQAAQVFQAHPQLDEVVVATPQTVQTFQNPVSDPNAWFNKPGAPVQSDPPVQWNVPAPQQSTPLNWPVPPTDTNVVNEPQPDQDAQAAAVSIKGPGARKAERRSRLLAKRAEWRQAKADMSIAIAQWSAKVDQLRAEIAQIEAERD